MIIYTYIKETKNRKITKKKKETKEKKKFNLLVRSYIDYEVRK